MLNGLNVVYSKRVRELVVQFQVGHLAHAVQIAINIEAGPGDGGQTRLNFVIQVQKVRQQQGLGDSRYPGKYPLVLLQEKRKSVGGT